MPQPSQRFLGLATDPLAAIPMRKRAMVERGLDVIDLSAGDASLPPPPQVVEALKVAADDPALGRYGFGLGHVPFREAIARWTQGRFGLEIDPLSEVIPLIGSKEGLSLLALVYLNPGDLAIIPEPGFISYAAGTLLGEGVPYRYPLRPENRFLVELERVPPEVLERAKLLYLNYPNNPTAATAPRDYLERTVETCRRHDILLVYDNAYSELTFDGYRPPSIFEIPGAWDVAVESFSLSKTYNMTGWRLGWMTGRAEVIAQLARVKSMVDMGQFMAVQAAGVVALERAQEWVQGNVELFRERRDAAVSALCQAGFACTAPDATMYLWIPLPENVPDATFAELLAEDEGVIVIPGSAFGAGGEGFFRISLTVEPERLREAAVRAGRVLARLVAGVP